MKPLYRNLKDALKIASGEKMTQKSFEKCEKSEFNNLEDVFGDGAKNTNKNLMFLGTETKTLSRS